MQDYEDNNERDNLQKQKKNAESRYGKNIKLESYKVSNTVIMISIIIGIFLIPSQLFLQGVMKDVEDPFIVQVQSTGFCTTGFCNKLISAPAQIFQPFVAGLLMVAWYLCFDSLLAFKGSIVTAVGIFFVSFLNLMYKDGRPFWNASAILSENHCVFSFASPSGTSFTVFFFNFYMLIMGRYKYAG